MSIVFRGSASANSIAASIGVRRRCAALLISAFVCVVPVAADTKPDIKELKTEALEITAAKITSFNRSGSPEISGGKLEWRGGLVLTSPHPNFGGWSGLTIDDDGRRLVAVSDSGSWMTGTISYDGKTPIAVKDVHIGPLLTLGGVALKRGRDRDAEAIALESGTLNAGSILVAFEQNARIARYDFSFAGGVSPTRSFLPLPPEARKMRRNSGFEAMTVLKGGALKGATIAFAERMRDLNRNHVGWIWSAGQERKVLLGDIGDFDLVDVASLDDGGLIVLERRFRWLEGMNMRIRRFGRTEVEGTGVMHGEVLLEADLLSEIDNMEGLAVSHDTGGALVLTLISDDNFNHYLQRTLLLQFAQPVARAAAGAAKTQP